jgi:glycosyltransferase involved in cell wall biosynthesis
MALDDFENKQLRAASKALQHRVSILSDEQWRLRGDAEASEARLREELEGARAAIFIERQKSAERSAQVAGLEEARADAEASRAIAAEEVRQLRSERQELQRRLSDLSDEQRRLGIDAEAAAAKSKEALETAFETLSMERQKSAELTDRLSEVEAARNLAETGCAAAAEKLRRLETELAARVQASAAESAAIKSLRAAQADTERENAGLRRLVDEFERTLTGERDALKEALASVADLRSALGSSTDELTQLDEMLSETRAHAAALSADREYRLAEIGGALSASRRREIDLNATVVQQANESAILSSELAEQRALARDNHGRLTAAEERHHLAVRATAALEEALSAELAYGGPVDIIVVNDGSTEAGIARKLDAVRDRLSDERCSIRIIHQSNKGLSGARNAGIATARGSFIQLLDSDDLLVAGKIDDQVSHLRNAAEIDVSISDCLFMNEMLDRVEYYDRLVAGFEYTLDDFAYNWERGFSIPIHCALFHRRVFERLQFPDTVKAKEDWIFWITLVSGGGRLAYMGSRTAVYRVHDKSMCRNMPALGRQWLKAATEIDGIIGDRCPGFMDEAVDWYVKVYRDGSRGDAVEAEPLPERRGAPASLGSLSMPAMLTGKPKISAIVPVFGHYDYLFDCISSLALQEVDGLEVVIVEDGSPDPRVRDLLETIPKASDAVKVHYNEANRGIAETQNIAVKMARRLRRVRRLRRQAAAASAGTGTDVHGGKRRLRLFLFRSFRHRYVR